jgi:hypothetical protein
MGISLLVIGVSVAIAAALAAYALSFQSEQNQDGMGPQTLDEFNVTQAREGSAVPLTYGRNKVTGNIIYYGGLSSQEIIVEPEGGGGKGVPEPEAQSSGYRYFLDVWQSVAIGKVNIINYYVNNKFKVPEAAAIVWNDGTLGTFPTQPGVNANAIPGVAHVFFNQLNLGENITVVPTIHFVIDRVLTTGINHENMSNGNNPAAIIYDILIRAGVQPIDIDTIAFNNAADYWDFKGYGLNMIFTQPTRVSDMINRVLQFVDGIVFIDHDGQYSIRAFNPLDTATETFNDDNYYEFTLRRTDYSQIPNDFKASYTDAAQDYTRRTIVTQNPAVMFLTGNRKTESIDLSAFRDISTASKRLFEIMKTLSYPTLEISFKTDLFGSNLLPGEVIEINNSDFSIVSAEFRVLHIDHAEIEKNEVKVKGKQMSETLFDDNFFIAGGTDWTLPDFTLEELTNVRIFELPFMSLNGPTGFEPAFLILAPRKAGFETGYTVLYSQQPTTNFENIGFFTTFCQTGTLDETYPVTHTIDESQGILYTPQLFDPEFDPISENQLFTTLRAAIIEDEIIAFQDIAPESSSYRLTKCIRGVLNTPISSHSIGTRIHIVTFQNNIIRSIEAQTFYLKILPHFQRNVIDASSVTAISHTLTSEAKQPRNPGQLVATRTGSNIQLEIFPNSPDIPGAGDGSPDIGSDTAPHPFPFSGDFQIEYDATTLFLFNTITNFTRAGAFTVTVKSRRFGFISDGLALSVGAGDGVYKITN